MTDQVTELAGSPVWRGDGDRHSLEHELNAVRGRQGAGYILAGVAPGV